MSTHEVGIYVINLFFYSIFKISPHKSEILLNALLLHFFFLHLFNACALALKTHTVAKSLLIKWKHNAARRKKSVSYILYLRSNQWIDEHVQCSNAAARMEFSSPRILKGWYHEHNHHSVSCLMTNPLWFSSDKLLCLYHIHTCSAEFTPLRTSVEIHKMSSVIN
jgi:hypothetical protein